MKPKVFIVDGHTVPTEYGQHIPYSQYNENYNEAVLIRLVSDKLNDLLFDINYLDFFHFNVDHKNFMYPLSRKIDAINYSYSDKQKDIAIELHFDYVSNKNVCGRSVIIGTKDKLGVAFRDSFNIPNIKNRFIMTTSKYYSKKRHANYGIVELPRSLGFIERVKVYSIIIENLFLSSKKDMDWLFSDLDTNTTKLALMIKKGIVQYYKSEFGLG